LYRSGKKNAPTRSVHFRVAGYSLGFEIAARTFTVRLGALHPALSGAGILASTAGGCGGAGTGAFTGVYVETFAGFFTRGSAHRCNGEHGGSGRGQSNSGSLLGCNHWIFPQVKLNGCTIFNRYASLEEPIFQKVQKKCQKFENL
jgi:hypothetical protein